MNVNGHEKHKHLFILFIALITFVISFINHQKFFDWFVLSLPIILMVLLLVGTYKHFKFTTFAYIMMLFYLVVLMIGATYTYIGNPLFNSIKERLDLSRNHYDRLTHLAFGFFPIFVLKEFLFRKKYLKQNRMAYTILLFILLGFAALWELVEFAATVLSNKSQSYMLSSQGDIWDTHWDMLLALIGGLVALLLFNKWHNKIMQTDENKNQK